MSLIYKKKYFSKKSGFSIIEMIVAVSIIIFAILGPMDIAKRSLAGARYSKDQITAYYLAEEVLEYMRYKRDVNVLEKREFLNNLNHCINDGGTDLKGCPIDVHNDPETQVCSNVTDIKCKLYQELSDVGNVSFSFYTHKNTGDNIPTSFNRIVRIKPIINSSGQNLNQEERIVEVEVYWQTGSLPAKSIFVRNLLLDWKEQPSIKFPNI